MCRERAFHRSGRGGFWCAVVWILVAALAGAAPAGIELTHVPAYGSVDALSGLVSEVQPSEYAVAVYILVPPYGWWTKPLDVSPLTYIQPDGTWTCLIVTGGADEYATEIVAFLVPKTDSPPVMSGGQCLPAGLYAYPYAKAVRYQVIEFANCDWLIKRAHAPVGPGPNYFSDSPENVRVDEGGSLHLQVLPQADQWHCAEVIADRSLGYGRYSFTVTSGIAGLDPQIVLGFFTWEDCVPQYHYREIDVEVSRWGEAAGPNTQFVVQPAETPGNRHRFEVDPSAAPGGVTTHEFIWETGRVDFRSYRGGFALDPAAGDLLESWSYTGPDVPPPGQENLRLNLWLMSGQPPTDGRSAEVVIGDVTYLPYEPSAAYRFWSPSNGHHFFTMSEQERDKLLAYPARWFWTYEGVAYHALGGGDRAGLSPIYRVWSEMLSTHFYTVQAAERDKLINDPAHVWAYEGTAFYAYADGRQPPGTAPVYRFWPEAFGSHFYTMDETERDKLRAYPAAWFWTYEGIAWHAYHLPAGP